MTDNQQFVAAVSATLVPSFAVLVGILLNNARLNDLNQRLVELRSDLLGRIGDMRADMNRRFDDVHREINQRLDSVDKEFDSLATLWDTKLGYMNQRVEELRER